VKTSGPKSLKILLGDLIDFQNKTAANFICFAEAYAFDPPTSTPEFIPNCSWYDDGNFISTLESRLKLALKANAWDLPSPYSDSSKPSRTTQMFNAFRDSGNGVNFCGLH
jgi:hypothetical protein